jgi:hypothetical protein
VEGVGGGETCDAGQDMEHKKDRVGSEYVIAYCVLPFIAGRRTIISQLVYDECNKTSSFVDDCGDGYRC